jgi:hypothetical protein
MNTVNRVSRILGVAFLLQYKSGVVPRALSLWGLVTIVPVLIATLLAIFDYQVPQFLVLPYFPFEFVIGV